MVDPEPPRSPWSVTEALGTGSILGKLSAILASLFRTVHEDGAALPSDKRLGWGVHSFLAQIASGLEHIPFLERLILVGLDPYIMVHLLHSLLSLLSDLYLTIQRIFACWGEQTVKGLPQLWIFPKICFWSGALFAPCREWTT